MKLFNGLIGWRANKQDTVTTSTTESELLALSQAAKEGQYIGRLLQELTVKLDDTHSMRQYPNNTTKACQGQINVVYVKSQDMVADGLTKALPTEGLQRFSDQIGLVDISERLKDHQEDEKDLYEDLFDED
jgi:hypothetical protein